MSRWNTREATCSVYHVASRILSSMSHPEEASGVSATTSSRLVTPYLLVHSVRIPLRILQRVYRTLYSFPCAFFFFVTLTLKWKSNFRFFDFLTPLCRCIFSFFFFRNLVMLCPISRQGNAKKWSKRVEMNRGRISDGELPPRHAASRHYQIIHLHRWAIYLRWKRARTSAPLIATCYYFIYTLLAILSISGI